MLFIIVTLGSMFLFQKKMKIWARCAAQEMQRWAADRGRDFAIMLNQYAGMEVAFHERCRDVWLEVAEQFGDGASNPRAAQP